MRPLFLPALVSRRQALQGAAALAASALMNGCNAAMPVLVVAVTSGTSGGAGTSQPTPSGTLTSATLTVTNTVVGTIASGFAGLSYEKNALQGLTFRSSNTHLIALFQLLGTNVLRIGGNTVDVNVWNASGAGQTSGEIAPADVDYLAGFLQATGWKCIYGINLGGAATGATTPALAAAEVAYVAGKLGSSLAGIEIGNECDLYGNTGNFFAGNWSLSQFETLWESYRAAIVAVTPSVVVTGPASSGDISSWTVPFGEAEGSGRISLLTQHYYRGDGNASTSTVTDLISADSVLISDLALLKAGAMTIGVPFCLAECNSYYNNGASGVSNAYASTLWCVDFLFQSALGGAAGVNLHGGGVDSYTPIADVKGMVSAVRPEYYGILLFSLAAMSNLYSSTLAVGSLNVTAYAGKNAAGGLSLVVVNKDASASLGLTITLPASVTAATLLEMTQLSSGASGPSLTATSGVTIQGAAVGVDGSFAPQTAYTLTPDAATLYCYVPALSAVLIQAS